MPERDERVRRLLDAYPWAGEGIHVRLLDVGLTLYATDVHLAEYLAELYAPLRVLERGRHTLTISREGRGRHRAHVVTLDACRVVSTPAASVALSHLLFQANQLAIDGTREAVLIHAAAVAAPDAAVVIPGPMGAGKSTLTAALVARGLGYLTDEVVALDPVLGCVRAYPKYLSLGSRHEDVLHDLTPAVASGVERFVGDRRLVPPETIRPDAIAGPTVALLVVTPRYERGAATTLEPLRPTDALMMLAQHAFHLDHDASRVLEVLSALVERSRCYRLVSGDLDDACDHLVGLLDAVREPAAS